jgi:tetratricopeptide (TPR) repeat protein
MLRTEALGALMPLGQFDAMFAHLERAQKITQQLGESRKQAAVSLQMAVLLWTRGRYQQGLDAATAAAKAAAAANSRSAQMTAAQAQIMLDHGLGRYGAVVERAHEVEQRYAAELATRRIMAGWAILPSVNVKVFLADSLARMGDVLSAQQVCEAGYRELQQEDHAFSRLMIDVAQTGLWLRCGQLGKAIDRLREDLALSQLHDVPTMTPCIVGLLAEALGRNGQVDEAQSIVERAIADKSYLFAGLYSEYYLRYGLGVAYATMGRHEPARAQLAAARDHAATYAQSGHEADALLALGELEAQAGNTADALRYLALARDRAVACSMRKVERHALEVSRALRPVASNEEATLPLTNVSGEGSP